MIAMDALAEHRQRHVSRLAARVLVRFHLPLIFLATAGGAVLASRLLFGAGLDPPALRYALAVLLAYALFVALVRMWIFYAREEEARAPRRERPDVRPRGGPSAHWDVEPDVPVVRSLAKVRGPQTAAKRRPSLDLDDGVVLVLVLFLLASLLGGTALSLVWQAPVVLLEAAFETLLVAVLVRAAGRDDALGWRRGVLRATARPLLLVLAAAALAGWAVQHACPATPGLADLLARCS
jgi:hypothetical protein